MAESATIGDLKFYYEWPAPADIRRDGVDLLRDPGLETAVLISLFSDRRADVDDPLPDPNDTRRGWWADAITGSPVGSKLWLFDRSKITPANLAKQEQYIVEALDWMKADGLASSISATASRSSRVDEVLYAVRIAAPSGVMVSFRFSYNWQYQIFGGI